MEYSSYTVEKKEYIKDGKISTKGYGIVAMSVMDDATVSNDAKALYVYLVCKSGGTNCCYPSNKTIMKALKMSPVTLRKYKNELLDKGLVRIEERKQKSGRLTSNSYIPTKIRREQFPNEENCD